LRLGFPPQFSVFTVFSFKDERDMARPNRPRSSGGYLLPIALLLVVGSAAGAWYGNLLPTKWKSSVQQLLTGGRSPSSTGDIEKDNVPPPAEVAAKELISIEGELAKMNNDEPPELVQPGEFNGAPALGSLPEESAPPAPENARARNADLGAGQTPDPFRDIDQAQGDKGITKTVFEQEVPADETSSAGKPNRTRSQSQDDESQPPRKKPAKKSAAGRSGAANVPHVPASASVAPDESSFAGRAGLVDQGTIQGLIDKGDIPAAHRELSRWFWKEPARREELRPQLEELAMQLYFAPQPHFEEPYVVQSGDLLQTIARKHKLTWEFLAKLNRTDPRKIRAGQKLKVTPGPFAALVSLGRHELIVHQNGAFVKSYRVGLGKANSTPPGKFVVKNKEKNPTYYGPDGVIAADDPQNPLGERWIDIGDSYGIHGTIDPESIGKNESRGCVRLLNSDVEEVYDFLVVGSEVRIVR
jgi:hypothetical protein